VKILRVGRCLGVPVSRDKPGKGRADRRGTRTVGRGTSRRSRGRVSRPRGRPISPQGESTARLGGSAETRPPLLSIGRDGGRREGRGPARRGGERSTPRGEDGDLRSARACARPPARRSTTPTPTRDGRSFLFELSPVVPAASRRIAYALARTLGDAVRRGNEETKTTKRLPECARGGSARSKFTVVGNNSVFLTGDRCFASSIFRTARRKSGRWMLTASDDESYELS